MNWQKFPVILIKAIALAGLGVGVVGSLLAGFFLLLGYVDANYGTGWSTFTFVTGVVFAVTSIALTIRMVEEEKK